MALDWRDYLTLAVLVSMLAAVYFYWEYTTTCFHPCNRALSNMYNSCLVWKDPTISYVDMSSYNLTGYPSSTNKGNYANKAGGENE